MPGSEQRGIFIDESGNFRSMFAIANTRSNDQAIEVAQVDFGIGRQFQERRAVSTFFDSLSQSLANLDGMSVDGRIDKSNFHRLHITLVKTR